MQESLIKILSTADNYNKQLPANSPVGSITGDAPIASVIDHTLLNPEATPAEVEKLCDEALRFGFAAVCVNPLMVRQAARALARSPVKACSVVGFPLGATATSIKVAETRYCLSAGAQEIDMMIAIGLLKAGQYQAVLDDIQAVARVCHAEGALLKVILEMTLVDRRDMIIPALLCQAATADYIKTSTGFGPSGATIEDVNLMRRVIGANLGIKATGGIRDLAKAKAMLRAGASRIGTSAGVHIVREAMARENQVHS